MIEQTVSTVVKMLRDLGVHDRDLSMYTSVSVKAPKQNLQFRRMVAQMGYENPDFARELWILCSRDPLFFLNTFAYLLETRKKQDWNTNDRYGSSKVLPFITRGYQDSLILQVLPHLGRQDIAIPKSRETGISWMIGGALAAWDWIFHDETHIGFVSKDLLSANNPDDPDALFSKFQFLLDRLPIWLLDPKDVDRNITKNTFRNLKNGSSLTAYPANADAGRGGRKAWMLMDEFHFFKTGDDEAVMDSTVHVTPSRVFVSTANRERGMAGAFYDVVANAEQKNGILITIDWKDDPDKRRGLYHGELIPGTDSYKLVIDDMDFWLPYATFDKDCSFRHPLKPGENYPFILDERYRSLYYDHVWNRPGSTPQSVSAELDRNFGGATAQIMNPQLLARAIEACEAVKVRGDIVRSPENKELWLFQEVLAGGLTELWIDLIDGKPPVGEYVFGADVSAGTGGAWSSYSALEGLEKVSGKQVFQWRGNKLDPIQFAELCVWVCKWFHNAYLVPEINGPLGQLFINRVAVELKYPHVFRRMRQEVAFREITERVGYRNNDGGIELLKRLEAAIRTGRVKPNAVVALNECSRYFMKNGKLVHSAAETTDDVAGKGRAHGDAAIALGCAAFGVDDIPKRPDEAPKIDVPYQSFLWRRQEWERKQKDKDKRSYWDEG